MTTQKGAPSGGGQAKPGQGYPADPQDRPANPSAGQGEGSHRDRPDRFAGKTEGSAPAGDTAGEFVPEGPRDSAGPSRR